MENEIQNEERNDEVIVDVVNEEDMPIKAKSRFTFLKKLNRKLTYIIIIVVVLLAAGFYYKNIFVAASVNGSFISRLSVISELEKQSGKQALDNIITHKLVTDELKKSGVVVSSSDLSTKISSITAQIEGQGSNLTATLAAQGLTQKDFEDRLTIQMKLEKLLADKIAVTDAEIAQYMKDNKVTVPKGTDPNTIKSQIKDSLQQSKFNTAANAWVADLRANASIKYYINY